MHRFLMIFGSKKMLKMGPKIDPKITQNAHRARLRPGTLPGSILGSFLAPGSVAHGPLLGPFWMPKLIKTCPWFQIRSKMLESWKNLPFWKGSGRVGRNLRNLPNQSFGFKITDVARYGQIWADTHTSAVRERSARASETSSAREP